MTEESWGDLTFEEKIQMFFGKMTEKQIRENQEQVRYTCREYCGKCPSYQGTGEESLAFCMEGKSSLITEKKGCVCGKCPISKTMSLRWGYYCTEGSAFDLSESEEGAGQTRGRYIGWQKKI